MRGPGTFCTVVNCMDGRTQVNVNEYLKVRFQADFVDTVTEAGPNGLLARDPDGGTAASIFSRIGISVQKHGSVGIGVVGHHDCAGNPGDAAHQDADTQAAVEAVRRRYPSLTVIGLWVDESWSVSEINLSEQA
jgi:hypothetical protein